MGDPIMNVVKITEPEMEVMKAITESVVEKTVNKLRGDIREEIERGFKNYFGDMTPAQHAVQHSRLDKFLNLTDKLTQNFWGQLFGGLIRWAGGLFLIGYFVWSQKNGTPLPVSQ